MSTPEKVEVLLKPDGRKKSGAANLVKARAARAANAAKRLEEKLMAAKARLGPVRDAQPESDGEEEEELMLVPRKKATEPPEEEARPKPKPRKPRKPVEESETETETEATEATEQSESESEYEKPRRRGRPRKEPKPKPAKPRKPTREELALQIGRNIALALDEQRHKRASMRVAEETKAPAETTMPKLSILRF